jgi:hypothetical protein
MYCLVKHYSSQLRKRLTAITDEAGADISATRQQQPETGNASPLTSLQRSYS